MGRSLQRGILAMAASMPLSSCGALIEYADGLRTSPEYTVVVHYTAKAGAILGVIAGIPVGVGALPVTYPVYLYQSSSDPANAHFSDSILLPPFALYQVCSLIAAPVDLLEFSFYRAWVPETARTAEEQRELEIELDKLTLPRYPVTTIYPIPKGG